MSTDRDRSSRTLTAGQLIAILSKVPPATPVVMMQSDEPSGDYGVRDAEVRDMKRDDTLAGGPFGKDIWHEANWFNEFPDAKAHERFDPPRQVVHLGDECPYQPVIDGEVGQFALPSGLGQP